MESGEFREGKSLEETPTWAVATVVTLMVFFGFLVHHSLKKFGEWLDKTKRKSLLAALEKIKDELMLFGVLSLLMGHWIAFFAKICVKSSSLNSQFYPCAKVGDRLMSEHMIVSSSKYLNNTVSRAQQTTRWNGYCPEGKDSFASHESLEQLHNFIFVLGVTHVSYSFIAIALAMIKIYSWRTWENQAKTMAIQHLQDSSQAGPVGLKMRRLTTFIFHHVSHPWSQHRVLVWMLCFSRQFWSSINQADYMALRLGFITTHQLPLTYDFHNYMVRSMEEEFRDIVGISVPFWIYCILCVFLDFHGTNIYFWLSFLPAILILVIGTKLHRVVVKLAVEIMEHNPLDGFHQFNLRDELFWFGRPRFILLLIQLISFQNAFEMASFLWSLWEIKDPSCFMENKGFLMTRLAFGIISQCWCSFITFPLYVIVTQMGSRFKKAVVSENVRDSLSKWKRRVKEKQGSSVALLRESRSTSSLDSMGTDMNKAYSVASSSTVHRTPTEKSIHESSSPRGKKKLKAPLSFYLEDYCSNYDMDAHDNDDKSDVEDEIRFIEPRRYFSSSG
ncbi:MLO-like protein 4 [Durio zibethinus]|uniref:MLO-like protein n=1 Tax=Durio zibethinus TaxID=66656 RepID=A0A6P5ZG31_DURZI|nr:MLO-like protein 4 [Durio zibethinus]